MNDFSSLFNLMPIGAYRTSPEGQQLRANPALVKLNGYESEADLLDGVKDIAREWYVDPNRRDEFKTLMATKGRVRNFVSEIFGYKSRKRIWIRENSHVVRNVAGEIVFYEGTVEDISEQHETEVSLQKERLLMRELIHSIPDAVWMVDASGRYQMSNAAYLARFAKPLDSVVGKTVFDLFPEDVARRFRAADEEIMASGVGYRQMQTVVNPLSGKDEVFEVIKIPMRASDGTGTGIIGLARDVNARELAYAALLEAKASAESAANAKADFLANMSHEIRTPLNAVVGMSELLMGTRLSPAQREFAETIRASSQSLMMLVNDILDFSKVEAGSMSLEREPLSVAKSIELAFDFVSTAASAKGLELLYAVADDVPSRVVGDSTRFNQVMVNLINNAVKFTQTGAVRVQVRTRVGAAGAARLHVNVQDTGIGIDALLLDRLFKPFSQGDSSTTRRFGGTGLGLSISHRIVTLMGGRMWVESVAGEGSNFQFEVPLEVAAEATSPSASPQGSAFSLVSPRSGRATQVLVCAAPSPSRENLAMHLRRLGLSVAIANTHRDPSLLLTQPNAIIVDAPWPMLGADASKMRGAASVPTPDMAVFCAMVADLRAKTEVPIVAMHSLQITEAVLADWRRLGVSVNLVKPLKIAALNDAIAKCLGGVALICVESDAALSKPVAISAMRILVAEDNAVNQLVIMKVLQSLGFACDVVSDGQQALDAVAAADASGHGYDAVLMDVQMPVMDGIEASKSLAQGPSAMPQERRPWIVAMTANAMQGDRERCMAAGMDDYVGKPIRIPLVAAAIERASQGLAIRRGGQNPPA